jgi:DNA-binding GntR family transcriptional regulator
MMQRSYREKILKKKEYSKETLRKQVYKHLRKEMANGNLLPGNAVSLKEICEKLHISTQPLRDALIRLEAEGFVSIYPRSRVIIKSLDINEIRYLFEIIGALENVLLESSFDKFKDSDIALMEKLNQEMRKAVENGDYIAFSNPHWDFHNLFIELSDNYIAKKIIKPMKLRLWNAPRRRFHKAWELMACDEHEQITKSIKSRNLSGALRVIKQSHWSFSYNEEYLRWVYFCTN